MDASDVKINIIGAGLAGLSAAKTLAQSGVHVRLISYQHSERAQSNLAEGGINAVMNVMGENDRIEYHFQDTGKGGCFLADPEMVRGLTQAAPGIVSELTDLGVPFHREKGRLIQRNFGGQKLKRTAYARSSTGKVLVSAMIDAVRRYEAEGFVERFAHHTFERLLFENGRLAGARIYDRFRKEEFDCRGPVIMACGGMNGMFEGATTGTLANTGQAAAVLFSQGVRFGNLEFLQYHPTTVEISGKRLLISEAARGEGGRLFCMKNGARCYFMEEKYGEGGNLMPRDVISREMALLNEQVYLDLTVLDRATWEKKLSDLREEVIHYLGIDPAAEPVPVSPGIHYFMGGILVDRDHRTNIPWLYAAGECACAYHGANRLGGNSLLGAIYGGKRAAESLAAAIHEAGSGEVPADGTVSVAAAARAAETGDENVVHARMVRALLKGMEPLRTEERMREALEEVISLKAPDQPETMKASLLLAEAILRCGLERKETRGAHTRLDYPKTDENWRKTTVAQMTDGRIGITYEKIAPYPAP